MEAQIEITTLIENAVNMSVRRQANAANKRFVAAMDALVALARERGLDLEPTDIWHIIDQ